MPLIRKRMIESPDDLIDHVHFMLLSGNGDLATDMYEEKDAIVVTVQIPGIEKEKIDVTVDDDRVTISASRQSEKEEENKTFFRREIRYGSFSRTIALPHTVEKDKAHAEYHQGVLTLTLPKKKSAVPTKLKITDKDQEKKSKKAE